MNEIQELFFVMLAMVLPVMALGGGILIFLLAMWRRTKMAEMRHRERLAMIERGMVPPPERDPAAYESMTGGPRRPGRYTSFGIAVVAIGLGLMMIIGFAGGAPGAAVGVGGAVALLGAAFIINGYLQSHQPAASPLVSRPTEAEPARPPTSSAGDAESGS